MGSPTTERRGELTIVGLGPACDGMVTLEAAEVLRQAAASERAVAYGTPHARTIALEIAPGLKFRSIEPFYDLEATPRLRIYRDLADMFVRRAFDDGFEVYYLAPGSPLFYNDIVWHIRRTCRKRAVELRIVHGLSFVDIVLEKVFWTGHNGLQLYSAWNVAFDGVRLSRHVPALLCQLGEYSARGDAVAVQEDGRIEGSQAVLESVTKGLLATHPPGHPVFVLSSSGHPDYEVVSTRVTVEDLASVAPVPVYSNLFVPAVGGPDAESDFLP